jgi:putative PIN family toxin of toxin-antitoxin system
MRVVIDTNVLLVTISDRSPFHLIYNKFIEGLYEIAVTTEILNEYAEIFQQKSSKYLAYTTLETIENATNTIFINRYFAFDLIKADPDDNKFVDCAIAGNADYIITNDAHFNVLNAIPFPKVKVLSIFDFLKILESI